MRTRRIIPSLFASALMLMSCGHSQIPLPQEPAPDAAAGDIARGEYIVRSVAVCGGCHGADPKDADSALSGGKGFSD